MTMTCGSQLYSAMAREENPLCWILFFMVCLHCWLLFLFLATVLPSKFVLLAIVLPSKFVLLATVLPSKFVLLAIVFLVGLCWQSVFLVCSSRQVYVVGNCSFWQVCVGFCSAGIVGYCMSF